MKAYVFHEGGVPWEIEDVPTPEPGLGEVLLKVDACGICGSDVHYRFGRGKTAVVPLIPGHEVAGTVVKLGKGAAGLAEGDRVVVHYIISCGTCRNCLAGNDNRCRNRRSVGAHINGGFAEYIVVPDRNAFKLPDAIPSGLGAILGCAVSTAYHSLRFSRLTAGETVVVFGLGGIGLHAVAWAKALGAGQVFGVDIYDDKLSAAGAYGADEALHSERDDVVGRVMTMTEGYGVDIAVECSGHPTCVEQAFKCLHGKVVYESGRFAGIGVLWEPFTIPEAWSFREGAFTRPGDHTAEELGEIIDMVAAGKVDLSRSVTHRFPFDKIEEALDLVESKKEHVIRAVLLGA